MNDTRFIELSARDRARGLLDAGTFRELLGPFDYVMSPWLEPQGIIPQADDGMVVAKGTLSGKPAVVIAIEGTFQGGSMGEVSGAKMAAALELAVEDIRNIKTQNRCESNNTADRKNEQKVKVLDLCTGSGCIGISVAKLCPDTEVTLADISEGALSVAKKNAQNLDAGVTLIKGNLFENIEGRFDYILSNPPYIPSEVIEGLMPEVKEHEPRLALDGEADGLSFYREIINEAPDYLNPDGRIYFEIGAEQGEDLTHLMNERGFSEVKVHKDLAGLDRIVTGIYSRK